MEKNMRKQCFAFGEDVLSEIQNFKNKMNHSNSNHHYQQHPNSYYGNVTGQNGMNNSQRPNHPSYTNAHPSSSTLHSTAPPPPESSNDIDYDNIDDDFVDHTQEDLTSNWYPAKRGMYYNY